MNGRKTYIALALMVSVVSSGLIHRPITQAATADDLRKAIEEKTKLLEQINAQIGKTQEALETTEAESKSLNKAIRDYDYRISQLKLGIQASEVKIEKLELEINSLQGEIATKETLIDRSKNAVAHFIRELDERERQGLIVTMLNPGSLAEGVFAAHAAASVGTELAGQVRTLQEIREELNGTLKQRNEKKSSLESEQRTLNAKQSVALDQRAQKTELLSTTKEQEKIYQQQLQALEKQQKEIGAAIDEVEAQLRAAFDPNLLPTKHPGVLIHPVPGAILSQKYGATAFAQKAYSSKFHNGIDFAAPIGTPILAARAGTVIAVGNNGKYQYGRHIVIQHDNGLSTLYAHLSKQSVAKGQVVEAGAVIGYVGNTGYSYGAHLHFTLYWSSSVLFKPFPTCPCGLVPIGVTVDPSGYL